MSNYPEEKPNRKLAVHLMAKPTGPLCNLNCKYCFYLEKEALFPEGEKYRMSDEVLETYIRKTAEYQTVPELLYAWQGGEPTMMGLDFFRTALELEKQYAGGGAWSIRFRPTGRFSMMSGARFWPRTDSWSA